MRVSITSAALIASLICTQAVAATYIQAGKLICLLYTSDAADE